MAPLPIETLLTFAAACLVIELTPGPNMAYLAVLSATSGRRAGLIATLGVALGLFIVGIGAALGITVAISNSRWLYETLRWAGVLYMLWLAWEGWHGAVETSPGDTEVSASSDARLFRRGLITNLLNPKAGIFYVAILPQFIDAARPLIMQTVTLSIIYVLIATVVHASIVALADAARPLLQDERRSMVVRRVLSLALAGIALWLFVETRR